MVDMLPFIVPAIRHEPTSLRSDQARSNTDWGPEPAECEHEQAAGEEAR